MTLVIPGDSKGGRPGQPRTMALLVISTLSSDIMDKYTVSTFTCRNSHK